MQPTIDRNDIYRPAALTEEEYDAFCRDMEAMEPCGQQCEPDEPPPEWFKTVPF